MTIRRVVNSILLVVLLTLPSAANADSPTYHTVAWGETIYSIARSFGVSPQSIASANGLSLDSWVYAGQVLKIPVETGGASTASTPKTTPSGIYTIRAGDTLSSIADKFGVSLDALAEANDIPPNGVIYVGWQLKIPSGSTAANPTSSSAPARSSAVTYIVQPGDNLFRIALRYNTSTQAIAQANSLASYFVYSGQRLIIPAAGAQSNAPTGQADAGAASPSGGALVARVSGIPLYKQQQTLTCEEASASMALRGALTEAQIVKAMKRSDDPREGIRGSTDAAYYGGLTNYGTHAQGLQKGLAGLGRSSTVLYGQTYADFRNSIVANLRAGKGVIWWTTWRQTYQTPVWVKTASGASVKLVPYEHTVVITATNDKAVTYNDPYDATIRSTTWANFQRVSAYFNNMALIVK